MARRKYDVVLILGILVFMGIYYTYFGDIKMSNLYKNVYLNVDAGGLKETDVMAESERAIDHSSSYSKNPITNDTIFVYKAYLLKVTTKDHPAGEYRIKMTAFASCHVRENYTFSPLTFTNSDGAIYTAKIWPMDPGCYVRHWMPACTWGAYVIEAAVPVGDVDRIGDYGFLGYKDKKIKISGIHKVKPRTQGLSVCIPVMYWFTNWPKMMEFVEIWRAMGASKFYFYYQCISREVYEVLKEYEKIGIVDPIKSEVMPTNQETGYNPDYWLYRIGDRLFQNDCIMRSTTKFAAYVDIDEILLPQNNQTLLEFLEDKSQKHNDSAGFEFNHAALHFESELMPFLKASNEDFDWRRLDFSWLKTAQYSKMYKMSKAVSITDRVNLISIHFIKWVMWPYRVYNVPHADAVYYHSRVNWAAKSKTDLAKSDNSSDIYDPSLRSFFNDDMINKVHENYVTIMENVEKSLGRKPLPHQGIFKILGKCMGGWRSSPGKCSPYGMCYKELHNYTEWVYANPSDYESTDLIAL